MEKMQEFPVSHGVSFDNDQIFSWIIILLMSEKPVVSYKILYFFRFNKYIHERQLEYQFKKLVNY